MDKIEISVRVKSNQLDRLKIMEIACKQCHLPCVISDQDILDEHCNSCRMRSYLFSDREGGGKNA